jgi:predicted amidohydrolase YtcJ
MLVSANNRFIVYQPAAEQVVDLFGVEQANQTAPRKSLVDGGIINSFEIDVSDPQLVFPLIKKGMDRFSERTGKVHGPGQRTDRVIQLKALTRWGAHYLLREDLMGTLEAGKFADFIVLDRDILTIPEEQIPDTQVLMTVMGGRTTHLSNALATELKQKPVGFVTWEVATPKGWEVPYYYEGPREAGTASCVGAGAATCREP